MNRNKVLRDFLESDATHLLFSEDINGNPKIRLVTKPRRGVTE